MKHCRICKGEMYYDEFSSCFSCLDCSHTKEDNLQMDCFDSMKRTQAFRLRSSFNKVYFPTEDFADKKPPVGLIKGFGMTAKKETPEEKLKYYDKLFKKKGATD